METILRDIRLAIRLLVKHPGFSLVAILTLGLGIGGSTAIFSVIDAALLRPLPYPHPERLVDVHVEVRETDGQVFLTSPSVEDVRDWLEHAQVFSDLAVWRIAQPVVVDGPEPERVAEVRLVSEGFLGVHGVTPFLGRGIELNDLREGATPVVMLGHSYWQTRFGGDREILGRVISVDNRPVTIVGVLPAAFYPASTIWRPFLTNAVMFPRRGTGSSIHGRLRPDVTVSQAQQMIHDLTQRLDQARGRRTPTAVRIDSLYDTTTAGYWQTTGILASAVAAILLIACVNVAGLLIARGATRRPELAIRAAIGAGRTRLVRQLLTESLVLAAAGGVLGLALASMSLDALVANMPIFMPDNAPVTLNPQALAFTAVLAIVTGLAFGLAPAVTLSRVSTSEALARGDRRHGSALSRRSGQLLIAVEIALAVVLLAGAGLMIRSFARVLSVDLGLDPSSFVTMEVTPVDPGQSSVATYYPALLESIRALPGIAAAGAVDHLALGGSSTGTQAMIDGKQMPVNIRQFLPGYFEAIGMRLTQGRFPIEPDRTTAAPAAIVNESAARQLFPNVSPLGRRFDVRESAFEVVGVVGDVRHRGPLREIVPEVYVSFGRRESRPLIVVVRPQAGSAATLAEQLRHTARAVGPRVVIGRIRNGSEWLGDRVITPRQRTVLLGVLGGLGLLLALVGVFGVTAYAVARRTQEIGVRMAFGARPADVVRTMLRDSMWPVALGIVAGLGAAMATTRVIASFLFETPPTDTLTFAAVAIALALAASVAAWVPARRAARVDPVAALRAE